MRYFLILVLMLSSFSIAAIYVEVDKKGDTTYSDIPLSQQAKKIQPSDDSRLLSGTPTTTTNNKTKAYAVISEEIRRPYTVFKIASPKDQESIQNQPGIPLEFVVEPALQNEDKIQVFVDGVLWQSAPTLHFVLVVDRGMHRIGADIIDKRKTVLMTASPITVFVHHVSKAMPNRINKIR